GRPTRATTGLCLFITSSSFLKLSRTLRGKRWRVSRSTRRRRSRQTGGGGSSNRSAEGRYHRRRKFAGWSHLYFGRRITRVFFSFSHSSICPFAFPILLGFSLRCHLWCSHRLFRCSRGGANHHLNSLRDHAYRANPCWHNHA